MNMSESIDHSGNNGGNNGEMVHGTDNSAALTNLNIDATVNPPPVDSGGDDKGFVSPRTLILEAKSLEGEDLPKITNTNVKAKHKWIEETLLKDTDSNKKKKKTTTTSLHHGPQSRRNSNGRRYEVSWIIQRKKTKPYGFKHLFKIQRYYRTFD